MDIADSSSDEFVETSDIEELEELLDHSPRNGSLRKPYHEESDISTRPLKRIKLAHNENLSTSGLPFTPIKRRPAEVIEETPYPSRPSRTIDVVNTSPVRVWHSPQVNGPAPAAGINERTGLFEHFQDPLPLHTPQKQSPFSRIPLQSPPTAESSVPFSPFEHSTTPLQSPADGQRRYLLTLAEFLPSPLKSPAGSTDREVEEPSDLPEPEAASEDEEENDINRLFSSPERPSEHFTASQASIPSESAPSSPDVSSTRSMVLDPSPSPPVSALSNFFRAPEPDPPQAEPEPEPDIYEQPARYSMRNRRPNQLKPYTADRLAYDLAIKAIPEAFVKVTGRERHHHHDDQYEQDPEEETQDREFIADDNRDEVSREQERNRRRAEKLNRVLNALDGEEENEEDRRKRRAEEKERKAAERERRKQEKERRRKEKEERAAIRRKTHATGMAFEKEAPSSPKNTDGDMAAIMNLYAHELSDDNLPAPSQPNTINVNYYEHDAMDTISIHSDSDVPPPITSQTPALTNHSDSETESDTSSSSDNMANRLDERKREILLKMYPKGLANKLLETGGKRLQSTKKAKHPISSEAEDDGPLLPGHTRVRRAAKGAEPKEIKGDSESELEMSDPGEEAPPHLAPIWSPVTSPRRSTAIRPVKRTQVNDRLAKREERQPKFEYDSSPESELEFIDDSAIANITDLRKNRMVRGNNRADSPRAEVTLIDYMLASTRVFGNRSHNRSKKRHRSDGNHQRGSKFKHDITTSGARGYGPGRQALLSNFHGYGRDVKGGNKSHRRHTGQGGSSSSRLPDHAPVYSSDSDDVYSNDDNGDIARDQVAPVDPKDAYRRARREKEKQRKARIRTQGLCVIRPRDGGKARIVSGFARGNPYVTLDVEQEGSRSNGPFLQPKIRQWEGPIHRRVQTPHRENLLEASRAPRPMRRPSLDEGPPADMEDERDVSPIADAEGDTGPEEFPILKDSGVPFLPSGIAFNTDTYIRKGWLHELISTVSPTLEPLPPPMPLRHELQPYQIRADASLDDLCKLIEKAFQDVFDFAVEIPAPDQQRRVDDWSNVIHHIGQGISGHLAKGDEPGRSELKETIGTAITRLLLRIKSLELSSNALDIAVFQALWIAVELSVRLGGKTLNDRGELASSPLNDSVQLLVDHLLTFGLKKTMKPVVEDTERSSLSEPTIITFTAELWTRLIHLCSEYDMEAHPRKRIHIFWQFVLASFKSLATKSVPDVALYEDLWHSLFSLCALSQISATGMTLAKVKLPACWELVNFLYEGISKQMDTPSLIPDSYVRYILARCFILNERWAWKIVDVSALVKLFVDKVFAPRKFANLDEEKPEFPEFLRDSVQDSSSTFDPKDPAYVLLLKFIAKASKEESAKPFSIKKLISLSEPVALVRFKRENHPEIGEMSMVINRISAAIIGVRLNPASYEAKVNQIRNCTTFAQADSQTRCTLIRGLRYWAYWVIHQEPDLSLDKLAPWAGDMAACLAEEWKKNQGEELVRRKLLAKILLRVLFQIISESPRAPEHSFLVALRPLLLVARDDSEIQPYARRIMVLIIDRWYKVVPPERPPAPKEVPEEESQDMYADAFSDIDWTAVDIPEELAVDTPVKPDPAPLKQALTEINMGWIAFRRFKDYIMNGHFPQARLFLSCWAGYRLLTTSDSSEKELIEMIKLVDNHYNGKPDEVPLVRTVNAILGIAILERCPMAYTMPSLSGRMMRTFFRSLICVDNDELAVHSQYIALILSFDYLRHPLLLSCGGLPPRDPGSGNYTFTRAEFLEARPILFETACSNLDDLIVKGDSQAPMFITYIQVAFSAMRNNLVHLNQDPEQRIQYASFCSRVVDSMKKATNLAGRPGMTFWTSWTPTGAPNS